MGNLNNGNLPEYVDRETLLSLVPADSFDDKRFGECATSSGTVPRDVILKRASAIENMQDATRLRKEAVSHGKEVNVGEILGFLERAVEADASYAPAMQAYADALASTGRFEEVVQLLRDNRSIYGHDHQLLRTEQAALLRLGMGQVNAKRLDEALILFSNAEALGPLPQKEQHMVVKVKYSMLRKRLQRRPNDGTVCAELEELLTSLQATKGVGELIRHIEATHALATGFAAAARQDYKMAGKQFEIAANGGEGQNGFTWCMAAEAHMRIAHDQLARCMTAQGNDDLKQSVSLLLSACKQTVVHALSAVSKAEGNCRDLESQPILVERLAGVADRAGDLLDHISSLRQECEIDQSVSTSLLARSMPVNPQGRGILICGPRGALPRSATQPLANIIQPNDDGSASPEESSDEGLTPRETYQVQLVPWKVSELIRCSSLERTSVGKEQAAEVFREWDANGDGFISQNELEAVLLCLGVPKDAISVIFDTADVDNDGVVSYEDFLKWAFEGEEDASGRVPDDMSAGFVCEQVGRLYLRDERLNDGGNDSENSDSESQASRPTSSADEEDLPQVLSQVVQHAEEEQCESHHNHDATLKQQAHHAWVQGALNMSAAEPLQTEHHNVKSAKEDQQEWQTPDVVNSAGDVDIPQQRATSEQYDCKHFTALEQPCQYLLAQHAAKITDKTPVKASLDNNEDRENSAEAECWPQTPCLKAGDGETPDAGEGVGMQQQATSAVNHFATLKKDFRYAWPTVQEVAGWPNVQEAKLLREVTPVNAERRKEKGRQHSAKVELTPKKVAAEALDTSESMVKVANPAIDPVALKAAALDLCNTREIFDAAMSSAVPEQEARHPDRADPGRKLLQYAHDREIVGAELVNSDDVIRRLFWDSMPESYVEIGSVEVVMQRDLFKKFLRRVALDHSSIEATFHGTRREYVPEIISKGLRTDTCLTGAYGIGAYVGTHAAIAHQYADADESGWRFMFCILVDVGNRTVKGIGGKRHDVTTVDRHWNPTQYCFVDDERLFVSHLITYRVRKKKWKRCGAALQDPFQRALITAVVRADRRARKRNA